jgi:RNA polymerase sigma factor (sigma-70 family)
MWSLSDESLLAGLASGDPESAAAFVRRFQARVFGLALTIVRDRDSAQDVAQETFIRAWRHAAAYDSRRGRVATWLLRIARNTAIEAARFRRYQPMDPGAMVELAISSNDMGPEERSVMLEDSKRLRDAIAALPHEQARALVLAAFYGRTALEISESEGIPLGTAKTRIRAAMLRLRAKLMVDDER